MGNPPAAVSAAPPDDPLGAFCRDNHAALAGAGSGPLAGLTFAAKDVFHVAGHRTGFGHPDWLRTHPPAVETAAAVQRLLDAGATMVGRTLTDELAYSLSGENPHYGTPVNPRAPDRIPGGSSNGSASAVAGGLVDFALGTDCGGSVRLPAGYCGIFGMRPTHGRVPVTGVIPFGPSFDAVGWFARDAGMMERVGRVLLAGDAGAPPARRLLIVRDAFALVDPAVSAALGEAVDAVAKAVGAAGETVVGSTGLGEAVDAVAKAVGAAGETVVGSTGLGEAVDAAAKAAGAAGEATLGSTGLGEAVDTAAKAVGAAGEATLGSAGLPAWFETFRVLQAAEIWSNHGAWIEATRPVFGPGVRDRLDWASRVTPERVGAAKAAHAAIRSRLSELLEPGDVLCLPTSPRVAPPRNTPTDDLEIRFRHQAMCLLCIAGLGGLPQISLPLASFEGLPLGLSLVGPRGSDVALLDLAQRVAAPA